MDKSSTARIFEYIKKHRNVTVCELSQLMKKTSANIRHHIKKLEGYDLIQSTGFLKENRGRPQKVYGVSDRIIGEGYERLVGVLLDTFICYQSEKERDSAVSLVANKLVGNINHHIPVMNKIESTMSRLNSMHYQACWEAGYLGPRIMLEHCPFSAILAVHPELCRIDEIFLETSLGMQVKSKIIRQMDSNKNLSCIFQMKEGK